MTAAKSSFVWYELMTTDVAAAKTFYGKVVGWNTQDMPMPDMTYTILQMGTEGVGGMMPLPKEAAASGLKPCWVSYIYADDVDEASSQLTCLGGTVHRAPSDIPGVGRFSVVSDPQGAMFQLFKPGQPGERTPSEAPGQIGWHELHTTDWPKAFDFYKAMFGWTKGDAIDMGGMGTYQLFTIKDAAVGAMFNSPAAKSQPFWLYYFNVDDIDSATSRLTDAGGKVMQGPMAVPGGRWIVQATDPQGAGFALLGPRK
jgi:predicted enzyme related to lactoylglutathione lyase